jgi:succinoglycan biosynthesis transport protein ExoP
VSATTEMDLKQYVRVLRAHWALIVLGVLVCTGAAAVLAWTRTPIYEAQTQLFVSTSDAPTDLSQAYQGGLFAQQRVQSYAKIVSSPPVAQAVIKQLGLTRGVQDIQEEIRASVPVDSVLIDVAVRDESPRMAKVIADAVGTQFAEFVNTLEKPRQGRDSPVKVSITRPARLPNDPVSPQKPLYLALGVLAGLVLGVGGAVLREVLDKRIRTDDDATTIAGAPVLGRITEDRNADNRPLIVARDPLSVGAEAYRQLRTNLRVLSVNHGLRSFVVSSAVASEGKTLVASNLGVAFAQDGHRVLLVDADLRRPRIAEVFGLDSGVGLTSVFTDSQPVESMLRRPDALPLDILTSGPRVASPSELLGSHRFANVFHTLEDRYDLVILDSPALLPVTDAAILAQMASGLILVARAASTRRDQLEIATESLRAVDKHVLGVVLTRVSPRERRYGTYGPAASDG